MRCIAYTVMLEGGLTPQKSLFRNSYCEGGNKEKESTLTIQLGLSLAGLYCPVCTLVTQCLRCSVLFR